MFSLGPWDAVVLPAIQFFSVPAVRQRSPSWELLVYGPAHLFRAAWLSGVSDYLREPWSVDELFLRLRGPRPSALRWKTSGEELLLEGSTLTAFPGKSLVLSAAEAELLRVLVQRRGSPVSRAVLGWGTGCSSGRTIDTLIGRLRTKLQTVAGPGVPVPRAVRGVGYRLP